MARAEASAQAAQVADVRERLRRCLIDAACELLRCLRGHLCRPNVSLSTLMVSSQGAASPLEECLQVALCRLLDCLPDALCPPEPTACEPVACSEPLACDYAVEAKRSPR